MLFHFGSEQHDFPGDERLGSPIPSAPSAPTSRPSSRNNAGSPASWSPGGFGFIQTVGDLPLVRPLNDRDSEALNQWKLGCRNRHFVKPSHLVQTMSGFLAKKMHTPIANCDTHFDHRHQFVGLPGKQCSWRPHLMIAWSFRCQQSFRFRSPFRMKCPEGLMVLNYVMMSLVIWFWSLLLRSSDVSSFHLCTICSCACTWLQIRPCLYLELQLR